jgi:hypothetical protein
MTCVFQKSLRGEVDEAQHDGDAHEQPDLHLDGLHGVGAGAPRTLRPLQQHGGVRRVAGRGRIGRSGGRWRIGGSGGRARFGRGLGRGLDRRGCGPRRVAEREVAVLALLGTRRVGERHTRGRSRSPTWSLSGWGVGGGGGRRAI